MEDSIVSVKKHVIRNVMIAFNYIDNAYSALKEVLKRENCLTESERNAFYTYGLTDLNIHKIRLFNVKKSLMSITGNQRLPKNEIISGEMIMERSNDNAVAFDYPNGVAPSPYNEIKYGTTSVPHPTNKAAKKTPADAIKRATLEGK